VLATDGDNLRNLALSLRKTNLARLYRRRPDGIFVSDLKQGEIGPDLFRKACEFGLEELVSKHRDWPCRSGREKHWIQVKNRKPRHWTRLVYKRIQTTSFAQGKWRNRNNIARPT